MCARLPQGNVEIVAVGIGSLEAAQFFCEKTNWPRARTGDGRRPPSRSCLLICCASAGSPSHLKQAPLFAIGQRHAILTHARSVSPPLSVPPQEMLYADPDGYAYTALGFEPGCGRPGGALPFLSNIAFYNGYIALLLMCAGVGSPVRAHPSPPRPADSPRLPHNLRRHFSVQPTVSCHPKGAQPTQ